MKELINWNPYDAYKYTPDKIEELLWVPHVLGVYRDTMGMLVKVDYSTVSFLYGYYFNWLVLYWLVPVTRNKAQWNELGVIKLQLHSIDDSSMSAWIEPRLLSELPEMWKKIEQFILDPELGQLQEGVNGELLLEYSKQVFPVTSLDYN